MSTLHQTPIPWEHAIGLPIRYERSGATVIVERTELDRLSAAELHLGSVLRGTGLALGLPLYINGDCIYYRILTEGTPGPSNTADAIMTTLRQVMKRAQCTSSETTSSSVGPIHDDAASDDGTRTARRSDTEAEREGTLNIMREIAQGPRWISVGGVNLPWADAISDRRGSKTAVERRVTCSPTGSERHLISRSGDRIRAAHPEDAEHIDPGVDLEISETRTEYVLIFDGGPEQIQLGFDGPPEGD